jgi:hypothetical protein
MLVERKNTHNSQLIKALPPFNYYAFLNYFSLIIVYHTILYLVKDKSQLI